MAHDVFISYSTLDTEVANTVCAALETAGHRCWIAPRDVLPGGQWSEAIMTAIEGARVMVLVYSGNSNKSKDVARELHAADNAGVAILPFRIEDVEARGTIGYFIGPEQWLDASVPPTEGQLRKLCDSVGTLLRKSGRLTGGDVAGVVATARAVPAPAVPAAPVVVKPSGWTSWRPPGLGWKAPVVACIVVTLLLVLVIAGPLGGGRDVSELSHAQEALDWVDDNCKPTMSKLVPDMKKTVSDNAPKGRTFWMALGSELTNDEAPYIVCGWNRGFSAYRLTDRQAGKMHLEPKELSRSSGGDAEAPRSGYGQARLSRLRIDRADNFDLTARVTGAVHVSSLSGASGVVALRLGYFTKGGTTCTFHVPDDPIRAGQTVDFSFNPIMEKEDEGPPVWTPFVLFVDLCDIVDLPDDYSVLSDSLSQLVDGR